VFWKWKKHKKFRKWSQEEDSRLIDLKKSGLSDEAIAKKLGRSVPAVRLRYYQLTKNDENNSEKGSSSQNISSSADLSQLAQRFGLGQDVLNTLMGMLDKRIEEVARKVIADEMPKIVNGAKNAIAQLIDEYAKRYESFINPQIQSQSIPSGDTQAQIKGISHANIDPVLLILRSFLSPKEPDINEIVEKRVNAEMDRIYKFIRLGTLIAKRGTIKKEDLEGL